MSNTFPKFPKTTKTTWQSILANPLIFGIVIMVPLDVVWERLIVRKLIAFSITKSMGGLTLFVGFMSILLGFFLILRSIF